MERQIFKISPSAKGAIFKLKRWFYANFYKKDIKPEIREKNITFWKNLAEKLIKETGKRAITEKATRLIIEYEKSTEGEFILYNVILEALELKPVDKFILTAKKINEETKLEILEELEKPINLEEKEEEIT